MSLWIPNFGNIMRIIFYFCMKVIADNKGEVFRFDDEQDEL